MKCKFNPDERLRPNYFTRQRKLKEENSLTLRTGFTSFSRSKKKKIAECYFGSVWIAIMKVVMPARGQEILTLPKRNGRKTQLDESEIIAKETIKISA